MDVNDALLRNMQFTLETMGTLDSCRLRRLGKGSFFLATGTEAASENWVFMRDLASTENEIRLALDFFGGLPFIWPALPGTEAAYGQALSREGLKKRGTLTAMFHSLNEPTDLDNRSNMEIACEAARSPEQCADWAETAWKGFDSPDEAPESFTVLAQGLAEKGLIPLLARSGNVPVGTALLSFEKTAPNLGVYYFTTLPNMRRKGVGRALIDHILSFARDRQYSYVTLQATPSGVPFYLDAGFRSLFEMPVHSFSEDIY